MTSVVMLGVMVLFCSTAMAQEKQQLIKDKDMLASMHEGCMEGMKEIEFSSDEAELVRYCDCNTREMGQRFTVKEMMLAGVNESLVPRFSERAEEVADVCANELYGENS